MPDSAPDCAHCPLACEGAPSGHAFRRDGQPTDARLVIVVDTPAAASGAAEILLWNELRAHRLTSRDVFVAPVVLCPGPTRKPVSPKSIRACAPRLAGDLDALVGTRVFLALGAAATSALRGQKTKLADVANQMEWSHARQARMVYTYSPAAIVRSPDLYREFRRGIQVAVDQLDAPAAPPEAAPVTYRVLETVADVEDAVRQLAQYDTLACDIETTGLDPLTGRILSLGFAYSPTDAIIIPGALCYHPRVIEALRAILEPSDG